MIGSGPSFRSMDLRPDGVSGNGLDLAYPPSNPASLRTSSQLALPTNHHNSQFPNVPLSTGSQAPQAGHQVPPAGHQVPPAGYQVPQQGHHAPQVGHQVPQAGHQVPQAGLQVPQLGHQVPQAGHQVPQAGHQVPQAGHQVPQPGHQWPQEGHQVPQVGHQGPHAGPQVLQSGLGPSVPVEDPGVALDPLSVVLTGMAQLQGLVTDIATSPKASQRAEVIKPGVSSLPDLPPLGGDACLAFSDWLHNARPALGDVSDNSEELWSMVVVEATAWYNAYVRLDPLGRLTSKPEASAELGQARWQRLSRRIETMILQATPPSVKEEISSARVSGLLPLMCKLFVLYGPGSLNEREIGLRNIQDPPAGTNVQDTIEHLRKWRRWCARMTELGGVLPDCALQVKAITKISKAALLQNPEVSFRVSLSGASLQVDLNPDNEKVLKLHAQILSELEAIHHRVPKEKEGDRDKGRDGAAQAKIKRVEAATPALTPAPKTPKAPKAPPKSSSPPKQVSSEVSTQRGPCTFYSQNNGCKKGADCAFEHNWAGFTPAEKALRCKLCGSKNHRAAACTAGLRGDQEKGAGKGIQKAQAVPKVASDTPPPPPPKPASQQHVKAMLADAARILQQVMPDGQANVNANQSPVQAFPMSGPTIPPTSVNSNQPPPRVLL